jgi:predicted Rossmann fold flavoprotein
VFDVAIVGGGAAGLATAIFTARAPGRALRIVVLDGASRLGAKILISGGGRCNITNRQVRPADYWGGDRRVVETVLRAFSPADAERFFRDLGVGLHEEERGKLFPDSNSARTVLGALLAAGAAHGVEIRGASRVAQVQPDGDGFRMVLAGGRDVVARRVVLATGGLSLPKSGSDGAGLRIAEALGHRTVPTTPALAPLVLDGTFHRPLSGISHEAVLTISAAAATTAQPARAVEPGRTSPRSVSVRGPLLWTHFGLSGPAALDASRHWHRASLNGAPVRARLGFLPGLEFTDVEQWLMGAASERPLASVRTVLSERLPGAVAEALSDAVSLEPATRLAHLPREARRTLVHALTAWDLPVTGSRGYNYAEATAGGVALEGIDRGSMGSKIVPGLFFAGEMLDVDGRLGGFNFQWAWSSAFVAARGVCHSLREGSDG